MRKVREIMQTDLITVPPTAPVGELVRLLERHGITGAPVVDEEGALVGIVTVRDVIRLARDLEEAPEAVRWGLGVTGSARHAWYSDSRSDAEFFAYYVTPEGRFIDVRDQVGTLPEGVFEGYTVEDIMTESPITVESSATLRELARLIRDRKVHRALVLDDARLVGIVTTSDIVRTLAE